MSFVCAEHLIEYAIRIGVDDIQKDPNLVNFMFYTEKHLQEGADLTPPGQEAGSVREPLPYDYFQKRLLEIPKRQAETGQQDIFKNTIPQVPDIIDYLSTANVRIVHGFPRDEKDLPAISITLGNEDEKQYLGMEKGTVQVDGGKKYTIVGADAPAQYMIRILSPNYDETVVWYYIIKYALWRYRKHIEGYGMREQSVSWLDVDLAQQYVESGLYIYQRSAVLSCVKDEDIPIEKDGFDELNMGVTTPDAAPGVDPGGPVPSGAVVPDPPGPPPEPIHPLEYVPPGGG
jgi:hypothetical protein